MARPMMIFAQWHGGSSYSYSDVNDRECFTSYREAVDALRARRNLGAYWPQTFYFINKPQDSAYTPSVGGDSYLDLYADAMSDDIIGRIEFGPRGGVRRVTA